MNMKLNPEIVKILETKNIVSPTEIQLKTISMTKSGQDLIGVSQTGTGKTLAFLLPLISQILESQKPFHALIIVPTRELAQQISDCIWMFDKLNIRYALLLGGDKFSPQVDEINKKPHIIVGTPGRIVKHIEKTKNFKIKLIRKLVFDEADRFFEQDFISDLSVIKHKLERVNQTLMFTATMTEETEKLCSIFMRSPKIIEVSKKYENVKTLKDYYCFIPEKYKLVTLYNLLKENNNIQIIVFTSLCSSAQKISSVLSRLGLLCECLHGKMHQSQRERVLKNFKDANFSVLFSTDLASRGLDIPQVGLVVNYDIPEHAKIYIHRVGRTARAGREGVAISLISQYDVIEFQKLEYALNRQLEEKNYKNYESYDKINEIYNSVSEEYNSIKKRR